MWIAEDDWDCSCTSKISPCQHVVLSVLAVQQGVAKPKMKTIIPGNIRYKLLESPTGVMLKRVWVQNSEELRFTGQGILSGFDESIERLFSYELKHTVDVAKERLHDLLIYLAKDTSADITFNHLPCKVSEHLAGPVAIVQNHPNGFIIRLARPKDTATYKGGLVMYDDGKLHKICSHA